MWSHISQKLGNDNTMKVDDYDDGDEENFFSFFSHEVSSHTRH